MIGTFHYDILPYKIKDSNLLNEIETVTAGVFDLSSQTDNFMAKSKELDIFGISGDDAGMIPGHIPKLVSQKLFSRRVVIPKNKFPNFKIQKLV